VEEAREPQGWLPAAFNQGWIYRDRIGAGSAGLPVSAFYAGRYPHSPRREWERRLEAGEIERNGQRLWADGPLALGDRLAWHRPPWEEAAVPASWRLVFDDGDLQVIDKPAGLPVLPAGGFLEHTLLRLLERRHGADPAAVPRPVHRLGRFTSGLLVCARRPATRAWLSAQLRESTRSLAGATQPEGEGADLCQHEGLVSGCCKIYRARLEPAGLELAVGQSLPITTPIGRRLHPLLGQIWCASDDGLPSLSRLTLLERCSGGDLVEVEIASGRPHQIRIHCAAVGAPLLGDPLYQKGGGARDDGTPGEGGYRLHAHRMTVRGTPGGERFVWEAPLPQGLH
jgi:23S rRNA pseudouridine1911/1915/1917 synthase